MSALAGGQERPDPREDAAAFDFLELFEADREAERERTLAEYLARFPEFELRVAREYLAATSTPGANGEATEALPDASKEQLGVYRLRQLLGRGGQGAVYLGEDTRLGRLVALKILDGRIAGMGSTQIERLRREAAALARLDHPGVCAIYDADLSGERPYLAMRYVTGETLAARLVQAAREPVESETLLSRLPRSASEIARVLRFVERVAYALDAAHACGLVHRDIKPGNIMIDRDGLPVLLDFGLACAVEDPELRLTLTGEVFGTLAYMSPEQLDGAGDLDARTDVYSLGVTLYECLTLRLPFRTESRAVLEREVREGLVHSPLAFNDALPRDLCIVLAKAMEQDRARRYPSARAFADDLVSILERRPIRARNASVWLRLWRWQQRHPVIAAVAVLLLALLFVLSYGARLLYQRNLRLTAYQTVTRLLQSGEDRPAESLAQMVDVARGETQPQFREALHTALIRTHEAWRISAHIEDSPNVPTPTYSYEAYSGQLLPYPGSDHFIAATTVGFVHIHEIATGRRVSAFRAHESYVLALALSPDLRTLVTGSVDGEVRVWAVSELGHGQPITTLTFEGGVSAFAFSPNGDRLAIAWGDVCTIEVVDVNPSGALGPRTSSALRPHLGAVRRMQFSPSGRLLWSLGEVPEWNGLRFQELAVVDLATSHPVLRLDARGLKSDLSMACWTERGEGLAVAMLEGRLRLYDGEDWAQFREHRFASWAHWVGVVPGTEDLWVSTVDGVWFVSSENLAARHVVVSTIDRAYEAATFSPDGEHVAVSVRDSSVRVLETRTWREVANLRQHAAYLKCVLWSSDARRLVTADHSFLHGWNYLSRPFMSNLLGHDGRVMSVEFTPDSESIVTAGEDGTVRRWDRAAACQTASARLETPRATARLSGSGQYVVTTGDSNDGDVLRTGTLERITVLAGHSGKVTDAWITTVGGVERAVTISEDTDARLWDIESGECLERYSGHTGALRYAAIDARRGWLATGGEDRQVLVFELDGGRLVRTLDARASDSELEGVLGRIRGIQFLPRTGRLVVSAEESPATFWDPNDDWSRVEFRLTGSGGLIACDPAETWIAVGEYSVGRINWFPAALAAPQNFADRDPTSWMSTITVRPAGDIGLVACRDGNVWLYEWKKRDLYSVLRTEHGAVLHACFSPDGKWVAAAYRDGAALVWPVDPMPMAEQYRIPSLR